MRALAWALAFTAVQVALLVATGRALAVIRPRPRPLPVRLLQSGLGLLVVFGLVAVALPPGHGPNYEAHALSPLRQMASAQETFRSEAGGVYAPPECLAQPRLCIPGYPGPALLAPSDPARLERSLQYRLTFHPGRAVTTPAGVRGIEAWAYVATPATRRTRGMRSFCVDSQGFLVYASPPATIAVTGAACPGELPAAN